MNLSKKIFAPIAVVLLLVSQVAFPIPAFAAGTVGTGTPASCTEAALDTALVGGGAVNFNCGGGALTITLTTTKTISSNTQINGGGLITLSGGNSIRLFEVNAGISLSLTGLTLTQGNVVDDVGGAILAHSNSTVNITNSTLSGNAASSSISTAPGSGHGGAIYAGSGSLLNITNSTFSNNSAVGDTGTPPSSGNGGAIYAGTGSTVTIDTSTFSGNSTNHGYGGALYVNGLTTVVDITNSTFTNNSTVVNTFDLSLGGGAIQNNDGTVHISGSTFNGNHVDGNGPDGGAIFNGDFDGDGGDVMTITNSTFENNYFNGLGGSSAGGAVRSNGTITITYSTFSNNANGVSSLPLDDGGAGAVTIGGGTGKLVNSIFANTKAGAFDCVVRTANASLDPASGGNLIENQFGCGTAVSSDPQLGALQNNGGPTQTMAIDTSSPAFDVATCLGSPQVDQRNSPRPQGGGCDIGAYELFTDLLVTINQDAGQADPTNASPINFAVVFSAPVADFATGDVTLSGTAGATTATVTGSGTTYNVAVSGMTGSGTVIATIAAGVATNALGTANKVSTSSDNTVTYDISAVTVTINQAAGQADPTSASPINFTVVFNQAVSNFATGDVTLTGTATGVGTTATVTGSGTTYNVAVSGMTGAGTVIASLAAGVASNTAGTGNLASTSTDNAVTYYTTDVTVTIGGTPMGTYPMDGGTSQVVTYSGTSGGPVVVKSSNGAKILASMLELRRSDITRNQWTGIAQVMGMQLENLSDKYVFPRYTNIDTTKYEVIPIANYETFDTHVTIKVGSSDYGPFLVAAGTSYTFKQAIEGGPVIVSSDNGARIVASLYQLKRAGTTGRWNGQSEMIGIPFTQLSSTYVLPYYDYTTPGLLPSLNIANADTIATDITVSIGTGYSITYPSVAAGTSRVVSYRGIAGGPVVVKSSNGAKIIASMLELRRSDITVNQWTGIAQVMGMQVGNLSDKYVFPRYTNIDTTKYEVIPIANYETFDTNVTIKVGSTDYGPYLVSAGTSYTFNQAIEGGPVLVSSDNAARIVASLYQLKRAGTSGRWNGQSEMMGIPSTQLSDTYVLPYYDYTTPGLLPSLNIAVP